MLIAEIRRKLASIDELDTDDPKSLDQVRGLQESTRQVEEIRAANLEEGSALVAQRKP